jgi:hypothetical protein
MTHFEWENHYFNDDDFKFDDSYYERDPCNGRCYRLEASVSLRPEMDGALVRRRIPEKSFLKNLEALKSALAKRIAGGAA